ncbi:MAG: hypothetical protein CFE21_04010 [Bacteroidetes bacterium B1(2017)]|nr:MAG: hypothetical protein CFE21_04010 [Bacteroidetes bacterium B1(2017)]
MLRNTLRSTTPQHPQDDQQPATSNQRPATSNQRLPPSLAQFATNSKLSYAKSLVIGFWQYYF